MSGSDKDDLLGRLLRAPRRVGRHAEDAAAGDAPDDTAGPMGLNPIDLLGLPPAQRDLITWLSRRKQAHFDELRMALNTDTAQLTALLSALKEARHIQEALIDGEIYYRVVFAGKVSRAARGLPEGIWARVDLDNSIFLRQIPMFRSLSEGELRDIANRLEARQYHRNEVILWQGGLGEGVYFIKSGIVGITRLSPDRRGSQIMTYLKQGDLLGEYGLLFEQNIAATATATALSEVDVLLMKRQDVLALLKDHPNAAIELVQMLAQRLLVMDAQSQERAGQSVLCLVFGVGPEAGGTVIGTALAMKLTPITQTSVVYTEHPAPSRLAAKFGFLPETEVYSHPGGFDIFVPLGLSGVPAAVRATLVMDRLMANYTTIVVGVSGDMDGTVIYMLERADQVVVVVPPDPNSWQQLEVLTGRLKAVIRPERTRLTVVCNRPRRELQAAQTPGEADFDIPWFESLPPIGRWGGESLPVALADAATKLANQLGRTNQIGIYIPAQLGTGPLRDTGSYAQRAVAFLDKLFGSATGFPSFTVSDSESPDAAGEKIYRVQTYVTKTALDRHLGEVLEFVEKLKTELGQEAMALEVNRNIMLV